MFSPWLWDAWECQGCMVRAMIDRSMDRCHAAIDQGVTLLDTGDFYGCGHNEMLIGRAIKDRRDRAMLSVKFGALRSPDDGWIGIEDDVPRIDILMNDMGGVDSAQNICEVDRKTQKSG
jgi:aryl-alcohol dehydrogenase-like predicted oxidoreductase